MLTLSFLGRKTINLWRLYVKSAVDRYFAPASTSHCKKDISRLPERLAAPTTTTVTCSLQRHNWDYRTYIISAILKPYDDFEFLFGNRTESTQNESLSADYDRQRKNIKIFLKMMLKQISLRIYWSHIEEKESSVCYVLLFSIFLTFGQFFSFTNNSFDMLKLVPAKRHSWKREHGFYLFIENLSSDTGTLWIVCQFLQWMVVWSASFLK